MRCLQEASYEPDRIWRHRAGDVLCAGRGYQLAYALAATTES